MRRNVRVHRAGAVTSPATANPVGVSSSSLSGTAFGSVQAEQSALEADYQSRISMPGVVWHHDFANEAEVDNFRWTGEDSWGNDPTDTHPNTARRGTVNWVQGDGVTGGACLETLRREGETDGGNWWRPYAPMNAASNGRGEDDPAANGAISLRSFTPTAGGEETRLWSQGGFYGQEAYHGGGTFDGVDYWFQCRLKLHPNREEEVDGGKLFHHVKTDESNCSQVLVTKSLHNGSAVGDSVLFVYRTSAVPLGDDGGVGAQPGRESNNLTLNPQGYWQLPYNGEWFTLMYHIRCGLDGNGDTLFQVWSDWDGSEVTPGKFHKVWDQSNVDMSFEDEEDEFGHNAILASGYMNGQEFFQDIWQRYDQFIFSKQPIACPIDAETVLSTTANGLSAGESADFTHNPHNRENDIMWMTKPIYYDPLRRQIVYVGKPQSGASTIWQLYVYDEITDTWADRGEAHDSINHNWMNALDPVSGDYYFHATSDNLRKWNRYLDTHSTISLPSNSTDVWAALAYHPNLFGEGYPGIYCWGIDFHAALNLSYATRNGIAHGAIGQIGPCSGSRTTGTTKGFINGTGDYVAGHDAVICSAHSFPEEGEGRMPIIQVKAGAGLSTDAEAEGTIEYMGEGPIRVFGAGEGVNHGKLVAHPNNPDKALILEANGTDRVWQTSDMGENWSQTTTHPFDSDLSPQYQAGHWGLCRISEYGVVLGMSSGNGTPNGDAILWKPAS